MAITNTVRSVTHTGNGATTAFEYTFQIPDAGSLFVQLLEISTGTLTDVAAIDYTATGLGTESGGFVNYPLSGSPLASTHKIIIYREVPATQTTIITNQVRYYADVAMRVWDRIVMMVQDLRNDADRSLRAPVGETLDDLPTAPSRAGKYLFFNATTGGVEAARSIEGLTGITASATEINVLDGLLASTAELNILDGATLTVAELNYVDGVTSAIQTQLDAKQPLDADLTALAGLASAGMIARTGAGTVAARTLTAGTGISISDGDGVAGNPTITNTLTVEATVLLGTLSATGVGTQTLSSLVLTSYKMLIFVFRAIKCSNGTATLSIAFDQCSPSIAANTNFFHGILQLDLSDGTWASTVGVATSATASGSASSVWGGNSGYTTATTSVTISLSPGNFDGGSIRIYGVK